ncbi:hypothetical protein FOL47_009051 [Perkinsus chesapeaki]|uniref:EF-hand domain-containing protein n=1 Tax=Perkinsus chesapeaki TaxID=330153 RepID=A0A7J6MSY1_PERCH|nr:hypothetical protein FOL47_009051 [Perkinsus chesapeaki]
MENARSCRVGLKAISLPNIHHHHHVHNHTRVASGQGGVIPRDCVIRAEKLDGMKKSVSPQSRHVNVINADASSSFDRGRGRYSSDNSCGVSDWYMPWVPKLPIIVQNSLEGNMRERSVDSVNHEPSTSYEAQDREEDMKKNTKPKTAPVSKGRNKRGKAKSPKPLPLMDLRELPPVEALREALKLRTGSLKNAYRALDSNGNGEVGFSELEAGLGSLDIDSRQIADLDLRSLFKLLDSDSSGQLSLEEVLGISSLTEEEPWPEQITDENLDGLWQRYLHRTRDVSVGGQPRMAKWEGSPAADRELQIVQRRCRRWEMRKEEVRRHLRENDEFSEQRKGICLSLARQSAQQYMGLHRLKRSGNAAYEGKGSSSSRRRMAEQRLKGRVGMRKSSTAGASVASGQEQRIYSAGPDPRSPSKRGGVAMLGKVPFYKGSALDRSIALRVMYDFSNLNKQVAARAVMEAEKRDMERMKERQRHIEGVVKDLAGLRRELCASTNALAKVIGKKKIRQEHPNRKSIGAQIVTSLGGFREISKVEPSSAEKVGFFAVSLSEAEKQIRDMARKHGVSIPDAEMIYQKFREVDRDNSGAIERDEFDRLMGSFNPGVDLRKGQLDSWWRVIDSNRTGEVKELLAYLARLVLLVCGEEAASCQSPLRQQQQPSLRHVDEFVGGLQCAACPRDPGTPDLFYPVDRPDRYLTSLSVDLSCRAGELLDLELYPDVKEVSESMAAFHAVRRHLFPGIGMNQRDVGCVVVGDGSTPRAAALFAYRTSWRVWSIDPQLNATQYEGQVNRLHLLDKRIEDCRLSNPSIRAWVIVCVHAHLRSLQDAVDCCIVSGKPGKLALVVAMPCCNNYSTMLLDSRKNALGPMEEYQDWGILSPHRTVRVWTAEEHSRHHNGQDESVKSATARSKGGSVRAQRSRKRREDEQERLRRVEAAYTT